MPRLIRFLALTLFALASAPATAQSGKPPLVLAAASLQESMTAAADAWAAQGHPRPTLSFAASSALARQVEAGAPADLFASADQDWMDELAARALLMPGSRANFVRNRLVVIAPVGDPTRVTRGNLARVLSKGPLAMADPGAVPAGKYGEAALRRLGAWPAVAPRVVRAENVRAALALVERGAAPYGIVYETDARASAKVRIAGIFPAASHAPIVYPIARLKASTAADAEGFRRFVLSRAGRAIFARFGFSAP
jgi:molybdate transport system substrate-binding protein